MYVRVEKTRDNNSKSVANSVAQKNGARKQGFGVVDNRPDIAVQRKLHEMANNNPQVQQVTQLQTLTDKYSVHQKHDIQERDSIPLNLVQFQVNSLNADAYGMPVVQMMPIDIGGVQQTAFAWANVIVPQGLRGEFAEWLTAQGNAFASGTPAAAGKAFINSMHPADVFEAVCDGVLEQGTAPVFAAKQGKGGNLAYVTLYWAVDTPALAGFGLHFHVDQHGNLTAGGAWLTGYPGGSNNHEADMDLDQQALRELTQGSQEFATAKAYEVNKHQATLAKFSSIRR
ncbi:MAG TPA: hypothetical protein VF941_13690 [Clostridia bacterium]